MKITDIHTITLQWDGPQIFDAAHTLKVRTCTIVEVRTDEGLVGIGEAGGRPEVVRAIIEADLKPMLLGQDPMQIERLWALQWTRMGSRGRKGYIILAMSGIDFALWDLMGKAAGMPIYRLLGGFADKIPAYASGGFYAVGKGIPELVEETRGFVAQGFQMMKMKVGRLPSALWANSDLARSSLREDIERVAAVREVLGPDRRLMVDANCVWDAATAIKMGREFEKYDVYFLEEPVPTDDIEGSALVAASLDMRVAGYETEANRFGFRDLIAARAVDIVQPDVILSGGFTECRKIAAIAEAHHMPCTPHAFSSALSLTANAHLIASLPLGGPLEFQMVQNVLRTELLTKPPAIDAEGYYRLPQGPGLGVEMNPDAVAKYRVA